MLGVEKRFLGLQPELRKDIRGGNIEGSKIYLFKNLSIIWKAELLKKEKN